MPPLRTCPITSAGQLRTELTYLRKCHADEATDFLSRIDPAIFASNDRVAMMQPLILGILEKQLKMDHLSTALSTSCPIINRDADEILQGLHKPWLEDQNKKTEARLNEIKNTIDTAYDEIKQDPSQPELKRSRQWSVRELAILHALYPILDHDYDAYKPIFPGRTVTQIATKIKHEHARGYLGEHQPNDRYKQAKAIHYKTFRNTATQLGLFEDRKAKRLASQTNVWEPTVEVPLAYKTEESAPNDSILTESSSSIAPPKSPSRVERPEESELVNAEEEQMVPTESVKPRRRGRPRKSDLVIAQKEETVSSITTSPRRRAVRPRKSELADTRKDEIEGIETASRRSGRSRKYEQLGQPQPIESTSLDMDEGSIKSEGDDTKPERSISSEPTTPRRRGRPKKIDNSKVKKPETLPISSHSGKSTAGKKRSTARSTTANSSGSPPNSTCVAS